MAEGLEIPSDATIQEMMEIMSECIVFIKPQNWIKLTNPNRQSWRTDTGISASQWMGSLSVKESVGTGFEQISDNTIKVLYPIDVSIELKAEAGSDTTSGWSAANIAVNGVYKNRFVVANKQWATQIISYNYKANVGDIITAYCDGSGGAQYGSIFYFYVSGVKA